MEKLPLAAFIITFIAIIAVGYVSSTGFLITSFSGGGNIQREAISDQLPEEPQEIQPCVEDWDCTYWSSCDDGKQTRNCRDVNDCEAVANKPAEIWNCTVQQPSQNVTQNDTQGTVQQTNQTTPKQQDNTQEQEQQPEEQAPPPCTEDWQCSGWSGCSGGLETRDCTDQNSCGTEIGRPNDTKTCIGHVVFTEVYYDSVDVKEEWVELYNPTGAAIDLEGWRVSENTYNWTLHNATIGPEDYLTIARSAAGFQNVSGCAPDKVFIINGLNNDGDQLTLNDASGNEIDFVAWEEGAGSAYPEWTISASRGKSLKRASIEADTDTASDWLGNENPDPAC